MMYAIQALEGKILQLPWIRVIVIPSKLYMSSGRYSVQQGRPYIPTPLRIRVVRPYAIVSSGHALPLTTEDCAGTWCLCICGYDCNECCIVFRVLSIVYTYRVLSTVYCYIYYLLAIIYYSIYS